MQVTPKLILLDSEQIHKIHKSSVRILKETGIQVESRAALSIFEKSEGVKVRDHVVHLEEELIDHAIGLAPSTIEVFNKLYDFHFQVLYGIKVSFFNNFSDQDTEPTFDLVNPGGMFGRIVKNNCILWV